MIMVWLRMAGTLTRCTGTGNRNCDAAHVLRGREAHNRSVKRHDLMTQKTGIFRRPTPTLPQSDAERAAAQTAASSGRVAFDARGNAVWEMRVDEKNYTRTGSTTLVRKLAVPSLSLEATGVVKRPRYPAQPQHAPQTEKQMGPAAGADGGNPYNRSGASVLKAQARRHQAQVQALRNTNRAGVAPKRSPGLLDRLFGRS
jgi:hypothetical protein